MHARFRGLKLNTFKPNGGRRQQIDALKRSRGFTMRRALDIISYV